MNKIIKYNNGLTLIVVEGGSTSVSFSIMVNTGCVNENEKNNGISHYIEHMNFKGTKEYNSFALSNKLDSLGSSYNAYTSFDNTCYYAQCLKENTEETFKVMSDAVFNSVYNDSDCEKEKQVIIEEINMNNDSPDEVCVDLICKAFYGDTAYGRTILGSIENVSNFTIEDVKEYMSKYYVAENTCVCFVGNITVEEADNYVKTHLLNKVPNGKKIVENQEKVVTYQNHLYENKDIEQAHLCLAFPTVEYNHPDSVASEIATNILGGGMSSRLFQKIREEMGLAYSVYSFSYRYKNTGFSGIYAGLNGEKLNSAYSAIEELLKEFNKGVTVEEFEKVRTTLKAGCVFSEDKALLRSRLFAKHYLMTGKLYDFEERLNKIDNVTIEDVNRCAKLYSVKDMASAVVGRNLQALK